MSDTTRRILTYAQVRYDPCGFFFLVIHPNIALFILPQNITCFIFKHLYLKILFLFGGNARFALGAEEDVVYVYALGGADAVMVEGTLC